MVSDSVTGRRLASASVTGWPENQERPMSPLRALPAQSKNWTMIGRSRPSSCALRATIAGSAVSPTMRRAVSRAPRWRR